MHMRMAAQRSKHQQLRERRREKSTGCRATHSSWPTSTTWVFFLLSPLARVTFSLACVSPSLLVCASCCLVCVHPPMGCVYPALMRVAGTRKMLSTPYHRFPSPTWCVCGCMCICILHTRTHSHAHTRMLACGYALGVRKHAAARARKQACKALTQTCPSSTDKLEPRLWKEWVGLLRRHPQATLWIQKYPPAKVSASGPSVVGWRSNRQTGMGLEHGASAAGAVVAPFPWVTQRSCGCSICASRHLGVAGWPCLGIASLRACPSRCPCSYCSVGTHSRMRATRARAQAARVYEMAKEGGEVDMSRLVMTGFFKSDHHIGLLRMHAAHAHTHTATRHAHMRARVCMHALLACTRIDPHTCTRAHTQVSKHWQTSSSIILPTMHTVLVRAQCLCASSSSAHASLPDHTRRGECVYACRRSPCSAHTSSHALPHALSRTCAGAYDETHALTAHVGHVLRA